MSAPTELGRRALKRLGRFLVGKPRMVYTFPRQRVDAVDVYTDTDWAGTRKSTSGGCIMLGRHTVKHWSSTQASVALSSGEAEFYGLVRAAGQGLGYRALLADLGLEVPVRVWTDSSAAIGVCSRQGLGKLRHIDTHTHTLGTASSTMRQNPGEEGAWGGESRRHPHQAQHQSRPHCQDRRDVWVCLP